MGTAVGTLLGGARSYIAIKKNLYDDLDAGSNTALGVAISGVAGNRIGSAIDNQTTYNRGKRLFNDCSEYEKVEEFFFGGRTKKMYEQNYLMHHGVKGMRWGIRRYQNYDGTYTQKGLARYKQMDSEYETQYSKVKNLKNEYKRSDGIKKASLKSSLRDEKIKLKKAKRDLNWAYNDVKAANKADRGKDLYRRGRTIGLNYEKRARTTKLAGIGTTAATAGIEYLKRTGQMNKKIGSLTQASIAAGAAIVTGLVYGTTLAQDKKMRAYVYKKPQKK